MTWKQALLSVPGFRTGWGAWRREQLYHAYRQRRESYARQADKRKLVYSASATAKAVRERLSARGYQPAARHEGGVHTFAFVPGISWHEQLLPDMAELGPVTRFDYATHGFRWEEFARADRRASERRREMNALAWRAVTNAHQRRPVDWAFVYASGLEISASLIQRITSELGVPVVGMCLDDKHCWSGPWLGDQRAGQIDLAPVLDLAWTSARVVCEWYLVERGRPLYLPEGFDARSCRPLDVAQDIPVSFLGSAYGFRPVVVQKLARHGIHVATHGAGWGGSGAVSWAEAATIINRSQVNLGMGGIGYAEELTNVKGRDFEIPGTGGGVYLTSYNADLAQHFHLGEEILCYRGEDELIELIRYSLRHTEEAQTIACRARERCLREHRWLHRYRRIMEVLGIFTQTRHELARVEAACYP